MRAADVVLVAHIRADLKSGAAREARESARTGQREIASALGVTRAAVSHWETGRAVPSAEHALAYARLLRQITRAAA